MGLPRGSFFCKKCTIRYGYFLRGFPESRADSISQRPWEGQTEAVRVGEVAGLGSSQPLPEWVPAAFGLTGVITMWRLWCPVDLFEGFGSI